MTPSRTSPFLSGQAASRIPEFPSFFNKNMYMQHVQLFPLEEVRREIKVTLCVYLFILLTCHKNTGIFTWVPLL